MRGTCNGHRRQLSEQSNSLLSSSPAKSRPYSIIFQIVNRRKLQKEKSLQERSEESYRDGPILAKKRRPIGDGDAGGLKSSNWAVPSLSCWRIKSKAKVGTKTIKVESRIELCNIRVVIMAEWRVPDRRFLPFEGLRLLAMRLEGGGAGLRGYPIPQTKIAGTVDTCWAGFSKSALLTWARTARLFCTFNFKIWPNGGKVAREFLSPSG